MANLASELTERDDDADWEIEELETTVNHGLGSPV